MPRILFIHSAGPQGPSEGSNQLLARLREALGNAYPVDAPAMPAPEAPDAAPWLDAASEHLAQMREPFALVGHSLGGSIILKLLAESGVPTGLAGVVTVAAPYWGAPDWDYEAFALRADAGDRLLEVPAITLLFGREDNVVAPAHLDLYQAAIPSATGRLIKGDHVFAAGDIGAVADAVRALPGFAQAARERVNIDAPSPAA